MEEPKCSCVDAEDPKDELHEMIQTLESQTSFDGIRLVKYEGFWFRMSKFRAIYSNHKHFKAIETDTILSTSPKSGTTWLKALIFAIVNRNVYPLDKNPLLTSNPHDLVPFVEFNSSARNQQETPLDLVHSCPRNIFATHFSFNLLPESIRESECRIIYTCRNPLDQFISLWHFMPNVKQELVSEPLPLEEAFDLFCQGIHIFGPFWDHIKGYWEAHLNNPRKVLFLRYEDLKKDNVHCIKKIAEFVGLPFTVEEEEKGVIEQISKLCSFENLRSLEVNKTGNYRGLVSNKSFFRKGEVGDWKNYLTQEMAERVKKLMESKLEGSGFDIEGLLQLHKDI